jgi:glutamate dehydrogenase (NAD(P)+)
MAWVRDEIGRAVGLPREIGGIPLDEIGATGFGVAIVAEVAAPFAGIVLEGARVAVQGFGSVGMNAARFLARRGVRLVAASDSRGTIADPDGLDIDALIAHKKSGHPVAELGQGEAMDRDAVIAVDCDIWIPAARPDVIRADNADRLRARLVIQGANIPVTEEAEARLHARGVVSVPDFIANAGGVICAAVEFHQGSQSAAFETIEEKVRANTSEVLEDAARGGIPPRQAAVRMADARVRRAMATRRWK